MTSAIKEKNFEAYIFFLFCYEFTRVHFSLLDFYFCLFFIFRSRIRTEIVSTALTGVWLTPAKNLSAVPLTPVNTFLVVSLTPAINFRLFGYF